MSFAQVKINNCI